MEIKNLVVRQNKKGKFYTIIFELIRDNNITKNWTTIAMKGNKYIFNSVIYKIDPEKAVFSKTIKSPDPEFYYNASLSEKVFNLILKSQDFTQYRKKYNIKFDLKNVYDSKQITEREENLKNLIKVALERDEYIGAICNSGEYYIPLFEMDPGWHIESFLPNGDEYNDNLKYIAFDKEAEIIKHLNWVIERLNKVSNNVYAVKIESFLEYKITNTGLKEEFGSLFGWDLPEDTFFYDEIFYTETITRIAKEMLDNNEEEVIEVALVGNPDVLDENISEYYIADSIIYDDESYFVDKMYVFALNKASYLAKIKRDFSAYLDSNTLDKRVGPKKPLL
ncbi:hypothetical protein [Peribacillus frigoritolerans]|uniref:hypothetical protein n=1 Tax=Peribacillus frigoritolerans TaxID=450367 RepID=UPI0022818F80|nr:hypothetical protein [Peribacillus frigoritolerans]MCY9002435.1 hypothetical protein [Peribacillus frigoritolerans]